MKVCTDCGHENSDDAQFCESCRGYLWAERDAAEEKQAVLAGQAAVDSTVDEQPAAVPPEREFDPPPPERPDFPEPHPDELICDQCGIGNRAEANFCRRCGSTLVGADVATRAPWWRRLRAQRPRTYSAGERRRRRQPVVSTATQKARRGMFQMSARSASSRCLESSRSAPGAETWPGAWATRTAARRGPYSRVTPPSSRRTSVRARTDPGTEPRRHSTRTSRRSGPRMSRATDGARS